ncbi:protein-arginine deiminase type-4 isoform X2 [Bubalus bubalis]|uniref:protein-arginine deiminase type-4 isoform X2 n=1 Tax=Bubalus bubalis TaxID=89462 RepID=UPI001E1B640D|nr:protein-arginine deiminase type-4 isoform X2 [Bubalus bubalis]
MAWGTVVHVAPGQPTQAVCVLGTETQLDVYSSAPKGYTSFSITASPGVVVKVAHRPPAKKSPTGSSQWRLEPGLDVSLKLRAASESTGDQQVQISYHGPVPTPAEALLYLTGVEISLSADISRTGKMKPTASVKDKRAWTWGPRGQGAILLVNCDRDNPDSSAVDHKDEQLDGHDLEDLSLVTLSTKTPGDFFSKHQLVLHVAKSEMDKVRVFQDNGGRQPYRYSAVLGPERPSHLLELPGGRHSTHFYVEGLAFPDASFPGLVSLHLSLLDVSNPELPQSPLFQDSVVFRVAPWIMTPNTQPPKEVYVCRVFENEDFLTSLTALAKKAKCKLTVCAQEESVDDRWMQDEMEIGYTQAPHRTLPVVFDSPRNRGLKDFPIKCMLGPDFGYVTRGPQTGSVTDLDSFGNLEVSPPVMVRGKAYPLGRILIGDSGYPRKKTAENKGHSVRRETERTQFLCGEMHRLEPGGAEEGAGPDRAGHRGHPAALQAHQRLARDPQGRSLFPKHGEHAGAGPAPGHPQALRARHQRPLLPGGGGAVPAGAAGPPLHLPRRLLRLPRPARERALRHQRAPPALPLQVVARGALSRRRLGTLLAWLRLSYVNNFGALSLLQQFTSHV